MFKKGFTLVEFIVIISIFSIISGVAFFNFGDFRSGVSLSNLAHDIALSARQAQVLGQSGVNPHGIHFDADDSDQFVIFQFDGNEDDMLRYQSGMELDIVQIQIAHNILMVCRDFDTSGGRSCSDSGIASAAYSRPNPEPSFYYNGETDVSDIAVVVGEPDGRQKAIVLTQVGGIEIHDIEIDDRSTGNGNGNGTGSGNGSTPVDQPVEID